MAPPAGPIYASTLHRRDRSWRLRRRRRLLHSRAMICSGAGVAVTAMLIAHFA